MKKKFTFLFLLFCLRLFSQISENYKPIFHNNILSSSSDYELFTSKPIEKRTIDLNEYDDFNGLTVSSKKLPSDNNLKEDILNIQKENPNIYGKRIDFSIDFIGNATKYKRDDHYIYLYKITTPAESEACQFIFSEFNLSENAKFYIYNDLHENILGAYTKKSYHNSKSFTTQPINGDYIILELDVPIEEDEEQQSKIKLSNIISIPFSNFSGGKSGDCNDNMDVNSTLCNKSDFLTKNSIKSVGLMLLPVYAGNKKYNAYCSGVLLNNTKEDKTPYFLTARHCANSFELQHSGWNEELIVMFNHEKSKDKHVDINNNNNTILGADILFDGGSTSDAVLLKLRAENHVLENYRVGFAGWDADFKGDSKPSYYGVSHPKGDYKKTTEFRNVVHASSTHGPYGRYLRLDNQSPIVHASWRKGIVEDGSSGSPLFNKNKVIGILSFGPKYNVNEFGYPDTKAPFEFCKAPMLFNSDLNNDRTHTFNLYTAGYVSFSSIFSNIAPYLAPGSRRRNIDSLPFNTCSDITIGPIIDSENGLGESPHDISIYSKDRLRRSENIYVEDPLDTFGTVVPVGKEYFDYYETRRSTQAFKNSEQEISEFFFTEATSGKIEVFYVNNDKTIKKEYIDVSQKYGSPATHTYLKIITMINNNALFSLEKVRYGKHEFEYQWLKFNNSTKKWEFKQAFPLIINTEKKYWKFNDGTFIVKGERILENRDRKVHYFLFDFIDNSFKIREVNFGNLDRSSHNRRIERMNLNEFIEVQISFRTRIYSDHLRIYTLNNNGSFNRKFDINHLYDDGKKLDVKTELPYLGTKDNLFVFGGHKNTILIAKLEGNNLKTVGKIRENFDLDYLFYHSPANRFLKLIEKKLIIFKDKNHLFFIKSEDNFDNFKPLKSHKIEISPTYKHNQYFFTNNYVYSWKGRLYNGILSDMHYINIKETEYFTDERLHTNGLAQIGNYYITSLDSKNHQTSSHIRTNTNKALAYFNGGVDYEQKPLIAGPIHTLIIGDLTYDKNTTGGSFVFYAKNQIILKPGFHSKPSNSNIEFVNMHFSVLQKNDNPENTFTFNQVNNPIYDPHTYKFAKKVKGFLNVYGKNYYNNESLSNNDVSNSNKSILNVFPNPSSNYIYVKSELNINDWNIYDINARIVLSGNNMNVNSLKVNLHSLPPGIYFFKFYDSFGILHDRKIIKK